MTRFGTITRAPLRVLDFDSECRPMHYSEWRPESQITAIAWSWVGEEQVQVELLHQDTRNRLSILAQFLSAYNEADIVTGHYVLRHDLPLINDHCIRAGFQMQPKLVSDTKVHMQKVKGLGLSQENLATEFGLGAEKHTMNGARWREANTLTPDGLKATHDRVYSDVVQHKELRAALIERDLLKPPTMWRP